ncbi:3'-5' exoribonuclease YhaM family protein [Eubacterium barkeri]|uniref:3'-5' exoribonuclease n=1 Tax=Eubacterium barkeri TaxID=1528 RepID=A0A1H3HNB3_EUBBA|nr:HD domain-containing protein [Eubacterium barkeri]SDY17016.1 3'-5' exoribonuclease [Eubacterium barkeri]
MKIKKFKKGDNVLGYLFIKNQLVKTAANGSRYFNMTLSDADFDTIEAKMWNVQEADEEEFTGGQLIKIKGVVQEYNGRLQLIVNRIRQANAGDDVALDDYVQTAPVKVAEMMADVYATIDGFENGDLATITRTILSDKEDKLTYVPAAKSFHHAIKGGLLYHTWSMLQIGKSLTPLYPFLNSDLLYAGILLHDIGKITEMVSDANGSVSDYSPEGKLLGHIVTEIVEIEEYGKRLGTDAEVLLLLKHMILSHHYEAEYGSPVRPMFPEAELLHHIDIIDARMNTMEKIEKGLEPGSFSEKVWGLDNIQMYRPSIK